jgi:hypothetical protein
MLRISVSHPVSNQRRAFLRRDISRLPDLVLNDKLLFSVVRTHKVHRPIEHIDLASWLFQLPEAEYRRCCEPDHITCGSTAADDGTPMSIHVELIGDTLMIQRFAGLIVTPGLCRLVSISEAFTPTARFRTQVVWTLSVRAVDNLTSEFTNSVMSHPTQQFMDFIDDGGKPFEASAELYKRDAELHSSHETPLLAGSIERFTQFGF